MATPVFHEPVGIILVLAIIFFISSIVMKQLNVPALVGMLVLGIIIGPNGLHILGLTDSIILLADIGLYYIMYVAGLEIDLKQFMKIKEKAVLFGLLSIFFPWLFGFLTALIFDMGLKSAILLGIIISSHTLIAYPIISELGVADDESVALVVGGTIITDVVSLVALAMLISSNEGGADFGHFAEFFGIFAIYIVFMLLIIPKLVEFLFKRELDEDEEFHLTLIVLFLAAYLAEFIELEPIIGAFFAGLAINRLIPKHSRIMQKIEFFGRIFFIPIFIIYIGMLVDIFAVFSSPTVILLALSLIVALGLGKFIASSIIGKLFDYDFSRVMTMYSLSIPQVGVTLATILIGVNIGLFTSDVLNAGILLMLVTASIPPILTQKYAKDLGDVALNGEDKEGEHLTERIIVPVTAETAGSNIIDLAGMMAHHVDGKLFPVHISRPMKSSLPTDTDYEDPEKILEESVEMANDMGLEVTPMNRVNTDTLEGILNSIHESKASLMLTEWLDDGSSTQSFSQLIDRLLTNSPIPMVITRFTQPINVVPKTILILRDYDLRASYLHDLISITKNLSSTLKNELIVVNAAHVNILKEEQIERIKPDRPFVYKYTQGSLQPLSTLLGADDLIIATLPPFFKIQSGGWSSVFSNDIEKLTRKRENGLLLFNFPKVKIHVNTNHNDTGS